MYLLRYRYLALVCHWLVLRGSDHGHWRLAADGVPIGNRKLPLTFPEAFSVQRRPSSSLHTVPWISTVTRQPSPPRRYTAVHAASQHTQAEGPRRARAPSAMERARGLAHAAPPNASRICMYCTYREIEIEIRRREEREGERKKRNAGTASSTRGLDRPSTQRGGFCGRTSGGTQRSTFSLRVYTKERQISSKSDQKPKRKPPKIRRK